MRDGNLKRGMIRETGESVLSLKKQLRTALKKKGHSAREIAAQLQAIDTSFLLHAFVNRMDRITTTEKRLAFYKKHLKHELRNSKI